MKQFHWLLYGVISSILLFNSCHKDVYDPEALERDYFIKNIPEGFNWSLTSAIDLEVIPYDEYSGQYPYTIEVFDKNPLFSSETVLYTMGWCTGTKPLKKTITLPSTQSLVYICQTTPGGRKTIKEAEIVNHQLICHFDPSVSTPEIQTLRKLNGKEEEPQVPKDAIPLEGNKDISLLANKNYVIYSTYTGEISFPGWGKCNLYIKGTFDSKNELIKMESNENIYLLKGGKMLAQNNCKLQYNGNHDLYIGPEAQLSNKDESNISIQFQNTGSIVNFGTIYANQITAESKGMEIVNKGQFYARYLKSGDSYFFTNECYTDIEEINMPKGSKLTITPGCYFTSEKMSMKYATIELSDNAILDVEELFAEDNGGQNIASGTGKRYALTRIKKLICIGDHRPAILFDDKICVSCEKYPENRKLFKIATYEDIQNGSTIKIEPGNCTPGNNYIPEHPQHPKFPKWVVYNQSYCFASEDNFPSPGDYDMNDLVVSLDSIAYYYIKEDDDDAISAMKLYMTLRAVGATRQLGAAIQLDELDKDEVKSITYSKNLPLTTFKINSRGVEENQKNAVIPLFDNAHQTLGINNTSTIVNTISNIPEWITDVDPCPFEITIEFTSPVAEDDVEIDELNYFTIVGTRTEKRTEIHLPDKDHTDLSSTPGKEQTVNKKFMWTIKIPGLFRYPHEWENIKKVFPDFESWVQSNGDKYEDWYISPKEELLYRK